LRAIRSLTNNQKSGQEQFPAGIETTQIFTSN